MKKTYYIGITGILSLCTCFALTNLTFIPKMWIWTMSICCVVTLVYISHRLSPSERRRREINRAWKQFRHYSQLIVNYQYIPRDTFGCADLQKALKLKLTPFMVLMGGDIVFSIQSSGCFRINIVLKCQHMEEGKEVLSSVTGHTLAVFSLIEDDFTRTVTLAEFKYHKRKIIVYSDEIPAKKEIDLRN